MFKNYDVVKITVPFELEVLGEFFSFDAGVEGVIVESYPNECLIELLSDDVYDDLYYALIEVKNLIKIQIKLK